MSDITLKNEFGPREIQPQSLWTGLTRFDRVLGGWQPVLRRAVAAMQTQPDTGIWLPSTRDSQHDLASFNALLARDTTNSELIVEPETLQRVGRALGSTSVNETGCWVNDGSVVDPQQVAEVCVGHFILEDNQSEDEVRICQTEGCTYHRHQDYTFDVPSGRRELVYPNGAFFHDTSTEVQTAWGDMLPSVQTSRQNLRTFQKRSVPFVPYSESLLTAGGISQISLLPHTGCWFVRSYYMTPTGTRAPKGWQYDGYGRLKMTGRTAEKYEYEKFSTLAHRIVWRLHNQELRDPKEFVLNHMCGFRACANPGHLEELSPQENNIHGTMMEISSRMIAGSMSKKLGIEQLVRRSQTINGDPSNIIKFWGRTA